VFLYKLLGRGNGGGGAPRLVHKGGGGGGSKRVGTKMKGGGGKNEVEGGDKNHKGEVAVAKKKRTPKKKGQCKM